MIKIETQDQNYVLRVADYRISRCALNTVDKFIVLSDRTVG